MRYHVTTSCFLINRTVELRSQTLPSMGKKQTHRNSYIVVGSVNWLSHFENILGISSKDEVYVRPTIHLLCEWTPGVYEEALTRTIGADLEPRFGNSLIHNLLTSITKKNLYQEISIQWKLYNNENETTQATHSKWMNLINIK